MRLKKIIKSIFIISSILFVFTACNNGLQKDVEEKAYLNVSVKDVARTILPEFDLDQMSFTLYGKLNGGDQRILGTFVDYRLLTSDIIALETGEWEFTLEGIQKMSLEDADGMDTFSQGYISDYGRWYYTKEEFLAAVSVGSTFRNSINKTINKGENSISFKLQYVPFSGLTGYIEYYDGTNWHYPSINEYLRGNVKVTLNLPEDSTVYVKAKMTSQETESAYATAVTYESEICEVENHSVTYSKENVYYGFYDLEFEIYSDENYSILLNTYKELVKVAAGCTSKGERTVTQVNSKFYNITYELGDGDYTSGYTAPACFIANMNETKLPNAAQVVRNDGYVLEAFYDNPEYTGKSYVTIGNRAEDITLYAKWVEGLLVTEDSVSELDLSTATGTVTIVYVGTDFSTLVSKMNDSSALFNLILSDITSIPSSSFSSCESLKSVRIPEGVTEIGSYAFEQCSSLVSIYLPTTLKTTNYASFAYCSNLVNVYIDDLAAYLNININDNSWGTMPFYHTNYSLTAKLFLEGNELTSIVIPETVKVIPYYAFAKCKNITSVTLSNSLDTINHSAFQYCSNISTLKIPDLESYFNLLKNDTCILNDSTSENIKVYINNEEAKNIVIPSNVRKIPNNAFLNWKNLETVTIPSSVTTIEDYAFYNCTSLTSVTIPEGVTSIGRDAFYYCTSLEEIHIPSTLASTGSWSFYDTSHLSRIYISSLDSYHNISFDSTYGRPYNSSAVYYIEGSESPITEIVIPDTVTDLSTYPLVNKSILTSVTLPASITVIPDNYFDGCALLASVAIPEGVTSIGNHAFRNCTSLTSVTIPEGVTSIGSYAFYYCTSLEEIHIPSTLASTGYDSFYNTGNLSKIYISSLDSYYNISFDSIYGRPNSYNSSGVYYLEGSETPITEIVIPNTVTDLSTYPLVNKSILTSVTLPASITEIPDNYFDGCALLASVTIPEGVTSIGSYAFYNCTSLTSVTIPSSVTTIENEAFYNCTSLTSVTIPSSVTIIENQAFYNCTHLATVTLNSSSFTLGSSVFSSCPELTTINLPNVVPYAEELVAQTNNDDESIVYLTGADNYAGLYEYTIPESTNYIIDLYDGPADTYFYLYLNDDSQAIINEDADSPASVVLSLNASDVLKIKHVSYSSHDSYSALQSLPSSYCGLGTGDSAAYIKIYKTSGFDTTPLGVSSSVTINAGN